MTAAAYLQSTTNPAVFAIPELDSVGLLEHEAADVGHEIAVRSSDTSDWCSTYRVAETTAAAKIIIDPASDQILGASSQAPATPNSSTPSASPSNSASPPANSEPLPPLTPPLARTSDPCCRRPRNRSLLRGEITFHGLVSARPVLLTGQDFVLHREPRLDRRGAYATSAWLGLDCRLPITDYRLPRRY